MLPRRCPQFTATFIEVGDISSCISGDRNRYFKAKHEKKRSYEYERSDEFQGEIFMMADIHSDSWVEGESAINFGSNSRR